MRPPHKTVFPSRGPPGSCGGGAKLLDFVARLRAPVPRFTLSPLLHPQASRGVAWFFRPLPRLCWRGRELQGLSALASPGIRVSPRPSHSAAGAGGSKEAGICFKRLRLETQPLTKSELVLDLPQPCRLWSRRRPSAGSAAGGTGSSPAVPQSAEPERSTAEVARPDRPGLPCGGSGRRAG